MELRHKASQERCRASAFNTASLGEILVYFDDHMISDYVKNYEVLLATGPRAGQWVDLADAFKRHDVIPNNHNTRFHEPCSAYERKRGYSL